MELILSDGTDFSVKVSPGDQRKLILTFAANPKKQAFTTPTSAATIEKYLGPNPAGTLTASAQKPAVVTLRNAPLAAISTAPAPSGARGMNLTNIAVTLEGIDIITDGPVKSYTAFFMTKPYRMVIDLPGVRNGISSAKLPIGSFGIDCARLGRHEGKSRIVFEGATDAVLRATLIKTDTGLRLLPAASPPPKKERDVSVPAGESLHFGLGG
jgi:hypothetical protein